MKGLGYGDDGSLGDVREGQEIGRGIWSRQRRFWGSLDNSSFLGSSFWGQGLTKGL